ncbi:DNA polymerase III subunit beta [Candidatus Kaiserbacteria bacterium CG10_big_fil_rev_8_21_14_0_10_49_17]|uniref:Beta sliding clamp n=1 Tax=Candidatus Kaiserbacteria bacterium CG10_big_fil_rev_8_21_14_0_10_49_17 TaxID=1974609 RepID=A0A2M6WDJ9_9BACT|nr:MAG: DNA polymerase III subunit beta [Candidatus Kaiserbacteria bacterium CG10_big_fil_rev_8_21_14_0_10_49_17]
MELECGQPELLKAISHTERIAGTNPTLPVLTCLLLETKKNELFIRSTNLDIGVESKIPALIKKEGVVAVPASIFYNTIQNISPHTKITVTSSNENITVKTPTSISTIKSFSVEDFPTIPPAPQEYSTIFQKKHFIEGITSVVYSASNTTIKPELSGVYIYPDGKNTIFVATDSFRLAEKSVVNTGDSNFPQSIIPYKNTLEVIRILEASDDDEVEIKINENQISFSIGRVYITSRLINGSFPDYKQIIPPSKKTEVIVLKDDFARVLKKLSIFTDSFNQITFIIDPKKKEVRLNAQSNNVGETKDGIDASISGDELDIRFNLKYLVDVLPHIHSDSIALVFNGPGKPLVIRGVSDDSFLYLVMPMNK